MMGSTWRWASVLAAPAILLAAACGGDDATSESTAQQSDVEALSARVERNEILTAIQGLSAIPMHELDQSLQDGKIDGDHLPSARLVIRYVALTDWPDELADDADALQAAAVDLVQVLDGGGDAEEAKEPSTALHEAWHQFVPDAWAAIGEGLPEEAGLGHHDMDMGTTPAADATAADGGDHASGTPGESH